MASPAQISIHPSQFPDNVRRDLLESLRSRQVNHKFHYDSLKQTQKWLALHQAFSPSRTDPDCAAAYDRSFEAVARRTVAQSVQVIGLGCGVGQKDARLLKLLRDSGKEVAYAPVDVSTAMVLFARQAALAVISDANCSPLVCDLATAEDLPAVLEQMIGNRNAATPQATLGLTPPAPGGTRLFTFFGMIPNFEPLFILPRLARLVRPGDLLLSSANLAPGNDYASGLRRVLALYDNAPTRDWLMTFLLDLGVENADGELKFAIEDDPAGSGLKRVAADFRFHRARQIELETDRFDFRAGECIRLFFSYRHTPGLFNNLLKGHGLRLLQQWITRSEEEGVFLVSLP
ncbi:MAG TPA: L-histidine N(alpha)-methyltransferase [Candidatus Acidoferrum sp.]|jgi:L-histidine N-alpha-methyltransferase|nr:L-histidine N(alpha)-methyltransferase [Candidatus Acidoferrum sp.]